MPGESGDDIRLQRFSAATELLVFLEHDAKHTDGG
jgi:hypothetical protein